MVPWTLLQLTDSALPTGGFAHSAGLEAAVQLGGLRSAEQLSRFATEGLWATGSFALPFVRATHGDPTAFPAVDARCDAATPGHVPNRASRAQGRAFLRVAGAVSPPLMAWAEGVERLRGPGHLAPAFGAALGLLGATGDDACRLFLFANARGTVSAGVRLGLVGPLEGQRLLADLAAIADEVLARCRAADARSAAATAPVLDLLQAHQDRLYSRLFQS